MPGGTVENHPGGILPSPRVLAPLVVEGQPGNAEDGAFRQQTFRVDAVNQTRYAIPQMPAIAVYFERDCSCVSTSSAV